MYKITTFCITLFTSSLLFAQTYTPIDKGSEIKFAIKNLGISTSGSISGIKGSINYKLADPNSASFNVSIDANSVNTGNSLRDGHLKKESYFNVKQYPKISFVSKNVSLNNTTHMLQATGTLTIKGVSKEITFPFMVSQQGDGLLFKATFPLNRKDFNVGGSSLTLSDEVKVSIIVFASKV